jgi:hypothetical protein
MKKILRVSSLLIAAALAACGGGGGSGGTSAQQYSISLRADKTQLPINIDPTNNVPGTGTYAPYTTTLYVSAETGGKPIPGGDNIFGCNMVAGLDSGALYYLDGKTEGAFRSITLGSNTGGNSFHFHASNQAGTARIECSVTDPRDGKIYKSSVDITVGASTGKPAWVVGKSQAGVNLGTSTNLANLPNSVAVQASLFDDANQAVPNPTAANLQVSVLPLTASSTDASIGAQLVAGSQKGSSVMVQSIGGTALFSLQSGAYEGPILLQLVADRSDNNVANGIREAITSYVVVNAYANLTSTDPLELVTESVTSAANGMPFSFVLEATGGSAPYTWSIVGTLPTGLTLNSATGLISGTPSVKKPGAYEVVLKVTDSRGTVVQKNITLTITGDAVVDALNINLSGCSGDINNVCLIPNATMGSMYQYAFSATGGDPAVPVTWTFNGLPTWLSGSTSGSIGFVSGTPMITIVTDKDGNTTISGPSCGKVGFLVTATSGSVTATRRVSFTLSGGSGTQACPL